MEKFRLFYLSIINGTRKDLYGYSVFFLLYVLSLLYSFLTFWVRLISRMRRTSLMRPTISIGNVTWGGTGKTPLVIEIVNSFLMKGKNPAVLMRGYGNDEDKLFKKHFPEVSIVCDKNRKRAARSILEKKNIDVFLLDDAFQQWAVHSDVTIVTIDALNPWGNGHRIPAGPLRESLTSLRRADWVIVTNSAVVKKDKLQSIYNRCAQYIDKEKILKAEHKAVSFSRLGKKEEPLSLEAMRGKKVVLFSGIGNPESFEKTIQQCEVVIVEHMIYPDHHVFSNDEIKRICEKAVQYQAQLVTTEKDAMRLEDFISEAFQPYVLTIKIDIGNYETLFSGLSRLLDS